MRDTISKKYKAIFNLFTSFGYFDEESSNIDVLKNFKNAIESTGHVVIDFLNIEKIKTNLKNEEVLNKGGIQFHIKRYVQGEFLIKTISFEADNKNHNYVEKVHCLTLDKAKEFALEAKMNIKNIFGTYDLQPFDKVTSDRLILILQWSI